MALIGDTSDLDTLNFGGKNLLPDRDSYTGTMGTGVVNNNIPGGLTKQGLQYFNSPYTVPVTYHVDSVFMMNYFKAFLRNNADEKFIASLAIDYGSVEEYVVQFIGEPKIKETGFNGTVMLTLQIQPTFDPCYDQFIIDYACMGKDTCSIFNLVDEGIKAKPNG